MTPAFEGTALVTLDAKGRFAVPALFRDALLGSEQTSDTGSTPGTVVLTRHPDGCLVVYPESVRRFPIRRAPSCGLCSAAPERLRPTVRRAFWCPPICVRSPASNETPC